MSVHVCRSVSWDFTVAYWRITGKFLKINKMYWEIIDDSDQVMIGWLYIEGGSSILGVHLRIPTFYSATFNV